jgi:hypothetical protein
MKSIDDVEVGVNVYENGQTPHLYDIGDIPMNSCPKCDSSSFSEDMQDDAQFIYASHECYDCGCEWVDRYDLVKRRIVYPEPLSAEDKLIAIQSLINMDCEDISDGEILDTIMNIIGKVEKI